MAPLAESGGQGERGDQTATKIDSATANHPMAEWSYVFEGTAFSAKRYIAQWYKGRVIFVTGPIRGMLRCQWEVLPIVIVQETKLDIAGKRRFNIAYQILEREWGDRYDHYIFSAEGFQVYKRGEEEIFFRLP